MWSIYVFDGVYPEKISCFERGESVFGIKNKRDFRQKRDRCDF